MNKRETILVGLIIGGYLFLVLPVFLNTVLANGLPVERCKVTVKLLKKYQEVRSENFKLKIETLKATSIDYEEKHLGSCRFAGRGDVFWVNAEYARSVLESLYGEPVGDPIINIGDTLEGKATLWSGGGAYGSPFSEIEWSLEFPEPYFLSIRSSEVPERWHGISLKNLIRILNRPVVLAPVLGIVAGFIYILFRWRRKRREERV